LELIVFKGFMFSVLRSGIATEDNLDLIRRKNFKYVAVSRKASYAVRSRFPLLTANFWTEDHRIEGSGRWCKRLLKIIPSNFFSPRHEVSLHAPPPICPAGAYRVPLVIFRYVQHGLGFIHSQYMNLGIFFQENKRLALEF
jgi:hypothetical protein